MSLRLDGFSEQMCCVHLEQCSGYGYPLLLTAWGKKIQVRKGDVWKEFSFVLFFFKQTFSSSPQIQTLNLNE